MPILKINVAHSLEQLVHTHIRQNCSPPSAIFFSDLWVCCLVTWLFLFSHLGWGNIRSEGQRQNGSLHFFKQQDITGKVKNTWFVTDLRRWIFCSHIGECCSWWSRRRQVAGRKSWWRVCPSCIFWEWKTGSQTWEPPLLAHTCNPQHWRGWGRRIAVSLSPAWNA